MYEPHHLLAEPLELGSWDILGRGGWDATEGVLALVGECKSTNFFSLWK